MKSYSISEALTLGKEYIKANIPFALEGPHGIGKSQGLQSLAVSLDYGFVDLRLTLLEETDLLGAPYRENGKTCYAEPIWLSLIKESGKEKGLLCLEELNRCDTLVRQPALQLLWDRKCVHWQLPSGWLPIATWNPNNGTYDTSKLDPALLSRLAIMPVRCDVDSWLSWARGTKINPKIILYIQDHPNKLTDNGLSPRSWFLASNLLDVSDAVGRDKTSLDGLAPILGTEIANSFKKYVSQKMITAREAWRQPKLFNEALLEETAQYVVYLFENNQFVISDLINFVEQISSEYAIPWFASLKKSNRNICKSIMKHLEIHPNAKNIQAHVFGHTSKTSN